jgi:hypothetical protein
VRVRPVHRARTAVACLVVMSGLLAGCGSSHHAQTAASCAAAAKPTQAVAATSGGQPPVPSHGAYFGGFALTGAPTQPNLASSFTGFAATACRPLDLAHVYLRWGAPFPTASSRALAATGAYPLISWTGTDTQTMASGASDARIKATAQQIGSLNTPVFLELRWEMDRPNLSDDVHSSADYIAAWDHTRQIFAAAGVHNASWVWCPTAGGFANGRAQAYYPGDNEVDWVCADAYPIPSGPTLTYQPLSHLLRPFLSWAHGHDKPIMIGEFGVPRSYSVAQRAQWLTQARTTFTSAPRVKAVAYFNNDPPKDSGADGYEIGDDPTVLAAFRALTTDSYFRTRKSN